MMTSIGRRLAAFWGIPLLIAGCHPHAPDPLLPVAQPQAKSTLTKVKAPLRDMNWIKSVSPDDKYLLVNRDTSELRVLALASPPSSAPATIKANLRHKNTVHGAVFTGDGRWLVTWDMFDVYLWDAKTFKAGPSAAVASISADRLATIETVSVGPGPRELVLHDSIQNKTHLLSISNRKLIRLDSFKWPFPRPGPGHTELATLPSLGVFAMGYKGRTVVSLIPKDKKQSSLPDLPSTLLTGASDGKANLYALCADRSIYTLSPKKDTTWTKVIGDLVVPADSTPTMLIIGANGTIALTSGVRSWLIDTAGGKVLAENDTFGNGATVAPLNRSKGMLLIPMGSMELYFLAP
jgi:hypothetical protein